MGTRVERRRTEWPERGHDTSVSTVMSIDNLVTGLVSACALRGIRRLTLRGQDLFAAMELAYKRVDEEAAGAGVEVRFAVFLDPIYGDSPVVREAFNMAVIRRLVSLDNPEFQEMSIKISALEAERLLATLPGGPALYEAATDAFLDDSPLAASLA